MSKSSSREHITLKPDRHELLLRDSLYKQLANSVKDCSSGSASSLRVLDIGSGRGELMRALSEIGCNISGMDADPECVKLCEKYGRCLQGKVDEVSRLFNIGEFDVIVCSHVLEHLSNPFFALESMVEIRAKSYVLAVPNPIRIIRILGALAGSRRPDHKEHVYAWGLVELEALLLRAGLKPKSWYADRVTINPFRGIIGAFLTRLLNPVETVLLPKLFPMLSSSLIVRCERINGDSDT